MGGTCQVHRPMVFFSLTVAFFINDKLVLGKFLIPYEKLEFIISSDMIIATDISCYKMQETNIYHLITSNVSDEVNIPLLFMHTTECDL